MSPKLIFGLVLIVLVAIFITQNTQVVEIKFLLWKMEMSRSLLLLGTLITGFILGAIGCKLRRK